MTRTIAWLTCCTLTLAACASTSVVERFDDHKVSTQWVVGPGRHRTLTATAQSTATESRVAVTSQKECEQHEEASLHRFQVTTRKTNVAGAVVFYLAAAAGVGAGIGVLADAHNVPAPGDPTTKNPVGRTGAYAIGGILTGLGAVALGLGVGTSARGKDSVRDLGVVHVAVDGTSRQVACHEDSASLVALVLQAGDGKVDLGQTDVDGKLTIPWKGLRALATDSGISPTGMLKTAEGEEIGSIDLRQARTYWADRFVAEATSLAERDDVEQATRLAERAKDLGADIGDVRAKIAAAPSSVRKQKEQEAKERAEAAAKKAKVDQLTLTAKKAIKSNDPDTALTALDEAEGLGADVEELRTAAAATPAARKRAAEAKRQADDVQREQGACDERAQHRERVPALPIEWSPLLDLVADGRIDRLQQGLNAQAAISAGNYRLAQVGARQLLAVEFFGVSGMTSNLCVMGLTAKQVRSYTERIFSSTLMTRFIVEAAGNAPMVQGVQRFRQAGTLAYLRTMTPKERNREHQLLAAAYAASVGEYGQDVYRAAVSMFKALDRALNR